MENETNITQEEKVVEQTDQNKKSNVFTRFAIKHPEFWKFLKFFIAGGLSSVVEIILHMILVKTAFKNTEINNITNGFFNSLGMYNSDYVWAFFISTTVGYVIAFILNRKITFKANSKNPLRIVIYVIMVVCTILFNTWAGTQLGQQLTLAIEGGTVSESVKGIFDLLIKIFLVAVPTLWTYPINRFIVHKKIEDKNND